MLLIIYGKVMFTLFEFGIVIVYWFLVLNMQYEVFYFNFRMRWAVVLLCAKFKIISYGHSNFFVLYFLVIKHRRL